MGFTIVLHFLVHEVIDIGQLAARLAVHSDFDCGSHDL